MKIKLHMDGDVNGYKFKIEGNGQGKPYEQVKKVKSLLQFGMFRIDFSVHFF